MTAWPKVVTSDAGGEVNANEFIGVDPSRYTVLLGSFLRPKLSIPGGAEFEWPLGIEGFTRSGSAALGIHKYIGDNAAVVEVMHSEEGRIEMNGLFPGKTSVDNMNALLDILRHGTPNTGKVLSLPGVFPRAQNVVAESWNFPHEEGDWTDSIGYSVTFVIIGTGAKVKSPKINLPNPNPTTKVSRGKTTHSFKVRDGARTLKAIAKLKYHDQKKWTKLYSLNKTILTTYFKKHNLSLHQLPTRPLPIGMELRF